MKSSIQISDPAAQTLGILSSAHDILTLLQQVQADPTIIPNLGQKLAAAYALSQPEKDERDAAAALVNGAQEKLADLQSQAVQVQNDINANKAQADSDIKASQDVAAAALASQKADIASKYQDIEDLNGQLHDRETAIIARESAATQIEAANAAQKQENEDQLVKLNNFSQTLADRLTKVTGMEQAALTA